MGAACRHGHARVSKHPFPLTRSQAIRELLRVEPGDRIDVVVQTDGTVTVEPAILGVTPLNGLSATKGRPPVSAAAMHAAIRRRVRDGDRPRHQS